MLVDVQVSWHNSTADAQGFFLPKVQKQMIVMFFDDITDILLMYIRGGNKRQHAWDLGAWFGFRVQFSCSDLFPSWLKFKVLVYTVLEQAVGYLTTLHFNSQQGTHPTLVWAITLRWWDRSHLHPT